MSRRSLGGEIQPVERRKGKSWTWRAQKNPQCVRVLAQSPAPLIRLSANWDWTPALSWFMQVSPVAAARVTSPLLPSAIYPPLLSSARSLSLLFTSGYSPLLRSTSGFSLSLSRSLSLALYPSSIHFNLFISAVPSAPTAVAAAAACSAVWLVRCAPHLYSAILPMEINPGLPFYANWARSPPCTAHFCSRLKRWPFIPPLIALLCLIFDVRFQCRERREL